MDSQPTSNGAAAAQLDLSVLDRLRELAADGLEKARRAAHRLDDFTVAAFAFVESAMLEYGVQGHDLEESSAANIAVMMATLYIKKRLEQMPEPDLSQDTGISDFDGSDFFDGPGAPRLSAMDGAASLEAPGDPFAPGAGDDLGH
jgi:hypothetical protein